MRGHSHPVSVGRLLEEGAGAGQEELATGSVLRRARGEDEAEARVAGHVLAQGRLLGDPTLV